MDLEAAGIPKETKEGKLDFHGLRVSFVTLAVEVGANIREAQTLARHSTPELTANVYAKTRDARLAELAESIGERVLSGHECATSVHRKPIEATVLNAKLLPEGNLGENQENGGGGIRTPVPRWFRISIYMRSRSIESSPRVAPNDRLYAQLFRCISLPSARTTDEGQPTN